MNLKSGDILFCGYEKGELSGAIDEVTQTSEGTHYSHMALVEILKKDTFVIHASLKRGVVKEPLQKFMQIDQAVQVDIYRLKTNVNAINDALENANKLVGLPYNGHYKMNDTSYYCSQLIYEVYKSQQVFELESMTFKNPGTNEFNEGWINYYDNLGLEIPEGEPGCNPNGLAASENLMFIERLK
ncbi:MAG: YiiX/YebB-like N1pC/P60 family cysteine hydrolase [Salinivirgaceae bacterium]|nr:YiiX/YebB-like N1pC/P60 family cysteine hydrolase [Salinivirgaceae bacterium]